MLMKTNYYRLNIKIAPKECDNTEDSSVNRKVIISLTVVIMVKFKIIKEYSKCIAFTNHHC